MPAEGDLPPLGISKSYRHHLWNMEIIEVTPKGLILLKIFQTKGIALLRQGLVGQEQI